MKKVNKNITTGQTVLLDGNDFENCIFIDCIIEWNGGRYSLKNVRFLGRTSFKTKNEQIGDAIKLMKMLGFLDKEFGDSWKGDAE